MDTESPQRQPLDGADDPAAPVRDDAALQTSEEQFRRAIEEAPIPVIMHAEDGEVLQISRSWTELTGYTLADVPTLDAWLSRAYGVGANAVRNHVRDLFAGNKRTLDVAFDIRTYTGELRHWSFSASSPGTLRDGRRFVVGMAVDITERTRTERALAEQARLLDLSNDAIIVRDVNSRILYWNRGATELYGWTREEALGKDLHTLLQTEFEAPFEELVARLREHDRLEGEVVQVSRDGRRLTLLCRWALDRDDAGRPGAILTTYNDITERKRAENALRESEAQLAAIFADAEVGLSELSLDGRFLRVNPALCRILARSPEELLQMGAAEITLADDLPASAATLQRVRETGEPIALDKRYVRPDGGVIWASSTLSLLRGDSQRPARLLVVTADITERKRAEQALRESEERFRLLVEGARDYAMFLLDTDNRITFWSAGAERVFGWSEAEALGQDGALIFTPEDRAAGAPEQERATAQAKGSAVDRRWHIRKDGGLLFVDGALIRLDERRGLRGFVKIGRDATAQRKAEEAVERANAELERRVAERTAALVATNDALQREILERTVVERERALLLRQLITAQEEERLRIARDLHDQLGQQITGLLLGLKQLEGPAEGTPLAAMLPPLQELGLQMGKDAHRLAMNLRPTVLDDVGLVPALEQHVADWSRQTGITAGFHSQSLRGGRLPLALETTLYRAVQEGLTNIHKYAEARSVSVLLERRGGQIVAIVEDDGRGFDPEAAPADLDRPRLGLRGMRERVGQLGGSVEIESSPGGGTTLFVRIPLEGQAGRP